MRHTSGAVTVELAQLVALNQHLRHRGDLLALTAADLWLDGARLLSAPWGLDGGQPGACGRFEFSLGTAPFDHGNGALQQGDIVTIITPGAGGYGPPDDKEPR